MNCQLTVTLSSIDDDHLVSVIQQIGHSDFLWNYTVCIKAVGPFSALLLQPKTCKRPLLTPILSVRPLSQRKFVICQNIEVMRKHDSSSVCLHVPDRYVVQHSLLPPIFPPPKLPRSLTDFYVSWLVGVEVVSVLSLNVCAHHQGWICRKTCHTAEEERAMWSDCDDCYWNHCHPLSHPPSFL